MRVLIVGGDSPIGAAFARALANRGDVVYVTTRRRETVGRNRLYLDLAHSSVETLNLPKVDSAFFCAAVSGFAVCRSDPEHARRVNVEGTSRLVRRLTAEGVYAVLLSSTAVFDFQKPFVPAEMPVRPLTMHGLIKAESERIFLAPDTQGAVLRLTKVIIPLAPLFAKWVAALRRGEDIVAFSDMHIAPIGLDDATNAMAAVAADCGPGVYQLSGARDISYFDLACHLAKILNVSTERVRAQRAVDNGIPGEEVPRYTTLESSRICSLTGRAVPDPYRVIEAAFELQHIG